MPIFKKIFFIHYVQSLAAVMKIAKFILHSIFFQIIIILLLFSYVFTESKIKLKM